MTVNGLQLPTAFERFLEEHRYSSWDSIGKADAYGHPLEADFMALSSVERMEQKTAGLARDFGTGTWSPEELERYTERERGSPGFIPYIDDFSRIICFGRTAAGAPFCFDFRDDPEVPSVIHWTDRGSYWRRIAPNFDAFISLFEKYEEEDDE